jgi:hypothetical protein
VIADRHSTTRGYAYVTGVNYPDETPVAGQQTFSRSVSVAQTGPDLVTPGTGYKLVTCTVSYADPRGGARSVAVSTVLTEYTP